VKNNDSSIDSSTRKATSENEQRTVMEVSTEERRQYGLAA